MREKLSAMWKYHKKTICILGILLVGILIIVGILIRKNVLEYNMAEDAKDGTYTMEDLSEHAKSENFHYQINGKPIFPSGSEGGTLMIRNPQDNGYAMEVTITLEEDGRELYQSEVLQPGQQVGYGKLKEALGQGEYAAIASFQILDLESGESIGETQAGITIIVEK